MKVVDLNKKSIKPDGVEYEGDTLGKTLSTLLGNATGQGTNALKFWEWSKSLFTSQPIKIDSSDEELLIKFIKENASLTVAGQAQLLKAIKEAKEE